MYKMFLLVRGNDYSVRLKTKLSSGVLSEVPFLL